MVLTLVLIGVAVALDPLPLMAFLVVLPSERGVRKGAAFVFGWLASLLIVVAVTVLATGNNPPKPNTVPSLAGVAVKIAIGVILVAIAIRQRFDNPRVSCERQRRWHPTRDTGASAHLHGTPENDRQGCGVLHRRESCCGD